MDINKSYRSLINGEVHGRDVNQLTLCLVVLLIQSTFLQRGKQIFIRSHGPDAWSDHFLGHFCCCRGCTACMLNLFINIFLIRILGFAILQKNVKSVEIDLIFFLNYRLKLFHASWAAASVVVVVVDFWNIFFLFPICFESKLFRFCVSCANVLTKSNDTKAMRNMLWMNKNFAM